MIHHLLFSFFILFFSLSFLLLISQLGPFAWPMTGGVLVSYPSEDSHVTASRCVTRQPASRGFSLFFCFVRDYPRLPSEGLSPQSHHSVLSSQSLALLVRWCNNRVEGWRGETDSVCQDALQMSNCSAHVAAGISGMCWFDWETLPKWGMCAESFHFVECLGFFEKSGRQVHIDQF